ncbi:MAG: hypothetical protein FIB06_09430 [Betaproteobacteria bacterium]|nr:hypothetical protein [Betaproteobacteria bacterium]
MLSLKDCIDMCDLTEEEVAAIAETENLPTIVAAQVGCTLLRSEGGVEYLRCVLRLRAERAVASGDLPTAAMRFRAYEEFTTRCPHALRD